MSAETASGVGGAMDDAFEQLKIQQACSPHAYGRPERVVNGLGRHQTEAWLVRCSKCDGQVSRSTLDSLRAALEAHS